MSDHADPDASPVERDNFSNLPESSRLSLSIPSALSLSSFIFCFIIKSSCVKIPSSDWISTSLIILWSLKASPDSLENFFMSVVDDGGSKVLCSIGSGSSP